ncbi:hypothetical protein AB0J38_28095 [Streptomyces sp. NPDC050095]|uniref:hypothetical protein n=1 Tax=unclassified Streptomyces TaxID=2593676 RepID=UPI00342DB0A6
MTLTAPRAPTDHAFLYLVRAAATAPSLRGAQPWHLTSQGHELRLYTTPAPGRADDVPCGGPKTVISCGAALFHTRLAMRHLGFRGHIRSFPDPTQPTCLASVRWGPYDPPSEHEEAMYRALLHHHAFGALFGPGHLPAALVEELRQQALREGAGLCQVDDPAALRRISEAIHTPWSAPGARGPTALRPQFAPPDLTALLFTRRDRAEDWLRAGQALGRVLLHGAAHDVAAVLHPQLFELPGLRAQLHHQIPLRAHPQLVLRLGCAPQPSPAPEDREAGSGAEHLARHSGPVRADRPCRRPAAR